MNPSVKENYDSVQKNIAGVKNIVLVMSGKGGVGKTSVSVNAVIGLARRGYKVGLMDIDLHGPNVLAMLGAENAELTADKDGRIEPAVGKDGIKVISLASNVPKQDAIIWRGPIKIGVILQFLKDVNWGDLDFLVIDSPPGTGDEPLTVMQFAKDKMKGCLIVTTPQSVALLDTVRSVSFAKKMAIPILGVVENMAKMKCPHCGEDIVLFPRDEEAWSGLGAKVIASVPFHPEVSAAADKGISLWDLDASEVKEAFEPVIDALAG